MKSFVNARGSIVTEAIDGLLLSSAGTGLRRLDGFPDIKVVLRADWTREKVALVSGGGSGHEPAHAGFVGEGLLTAAVCGEIFASPSVDAVLAAILAVTGEAGCLLIVKSYTGDRLNFGLAAERARSMGLAVEMVVVADDVALPDVAHPRGIAGTLFVHKIAGAAAAAGRSLHEVKAVADDAARHTRSLGLSLTTCHVPGVDAAERLAADEVEIGLGIHGEPGAATLPFAPADKLVAELADRLEAALPEGCEDIVLLVNALGAVPPIEMSVVVSALARTALAKRTRWIVGPAPFMTALDMRGVSLSALALDDRRLEALLAPAAPIAWLAPRRFERSETLPLPTLRPAQGAAASDHPAARALITAAAGILAESAGEIDAIDARIGDGDTGSTFAAAAAAVRARLDDLPLADGPALLSAVGGILSKAAGGSSGVLLAIFFEAAGADLARQRNWAKAFESGLDRMMAYGGARPGDRTMIDAIDPALRAFSADRSLAAAATAARGGADATAKLAEARAGRSAYVPAASLAGTVDPGAEAVARLLEGLAARLPDLHFDGGVTSR